MEAIGINLGLIIIQIIAFTIVMLTLNAWVYKPMLNMMETRKQKQARLSVKQRNARLLLVRM